MTPQSGPMAAVTGARRGRRDLTGARLIDPLTGPRSTTGYQDEPTPIYDELIAELGIPGMLAGPGPLVPGVVETPTLPIPLRLTAVLPAADEVVPLGAAVEASA